VDKIDAHRKLDAGATPGFTDVYGRLRWDRPSVTITAKSRSPSSGRFLHPEQHRNITVREAALLQGFPHGYTFYGPPTQQYRQIGEAVPQSLPVRWRSLSSTTSRRGKMIAFRESAGPKEASQPRAWSR
jgi:site-specific DNA-cytosine methylase